MNSLTNISSKQLLRAAQIKEQIESLETELAQLLGGSENHKETKPGGRTMSNAARAKIAAAARARWAKVRAAKGKANVAEPKPKRRMSAAGRARIAAAAKARWARERAAARG